MMVLIFDKSNNSFINYNFWREKFSDVFRFTKLLFAIISGDFFFFWMFISFFKDTKLRFNA